MNQKATKTVSLCLSSSHLVKWPTLRCFLIEEIGWKCQKNKKSKQKFDQTTEANFLTIVRSIKIWKWKRENEKRETLFSGLKTSGFAS
jgi:hypothetical protein